MRESYQSKIEAGIVDRYRKLEHEVMDDIVRRIRKTGKITSTADWQLNRLLILGKSSSDLQKIVASAVNYNSDEVEKLYEAVIADEYTRYKPQYEEITHEFIPYEDNYELQQITEAMIKQTEGELTNITKSMGFMLDYGGDKGLVYTPLSTIYNDYLDQAMVDLTSGAFDYNTIIRRTVDQLTRSGLRTDHAFSVNPTDYTGIDYPSGWHNRIDVAARRAILTGVSQLSGRVMDMNAERLGVDKYEVSWHVGARPDHAAWQGKVYTKKQLEDICGLGTGAGLLGWNCRHEYYLFFPGSERLYTDEWLEAQNKREAQKKTFRGKEYNTYEATQKQRQMETNMRAQRNKVALLKSGGADNEDIVIAQCKYQAQLEEYKAFCNRFGFLEQRERIYYDLKGRIAPSKATYDEWVRAEANKKVVTIATPKISEYLLKPGAKHADEFFAVGYTDSESDQRRLRRNILGQYDKSKADSSKNLTDGGESFTIPMMLGTGSKKRTFRTVWQIDRKGDKPRFITAYRQGG
ncbi:MAG: phage minor capsid protein [Clostridia bacterium]|nr:phage minor capsid protein [Clostridia bacterium]MBR1677811.1 phage minor capsid protein [Clostridia bacterium]